uniref:Peptidase S54 rhomboid domain-containing protein n=1 Tax=Prevotella sp. GTC17262 TaxID=3236797 RepID=A0AB33JIH6_9BACT
MATHSRKKNNPKRDWPLIRVISFRLLSLSLGAALLYFLFLWLAWDTPLVQHIGKELREFGIPLLLSLVVLGCTWNIDEAFPHSDTRRFSYPVLATFGTLILGITMTFQTTESKSSVLHVKTLQQVEDLSQTDWIHVSRLEVDTTHSGTYTHMRSKPQRYGADKLYFEMLDVYEVNKLPNVYIGTVFTSREYSSMNSEEKLEKHYNEFYYQGINRHAYPRNNLPYLLKHEHHSDLYKGFIQAVTNGNFNHIAPEEATIFRLADENEIPSGHFNYLLVCCIIIAYCLITFLIVALGKPTRKLYEECREPWLKTIFLLLLTSPAVLGAAKRKGEIHEPKKTERRWHIIMGVLIALPPIVSIIYYLAMVFSGVSLMSPDVSEIISWGGANSYLVMESGEWWRIATAFFLHGNLIHIAYNLINYWLILYLYIFTIGSRRLIFSFYLSGLLSIFFAISLSPHTVVGLSGGLMGMYGYTIVNILLEHKAKDSIGLVAIMAGFTLLFSFQATVSLAAHLSGLLAGCTLAFIYYIYDQKENIFE